MSRDQIRREEEEEYRGKVDILYNKFYKDPSSGVFLDNSTNRIYQTARQDASLVPIDRKTIERYRLSLEVLSRDRQRRYLPSKIRYKSWRSWVVHGPKNILAGINRSIGWSVRPSVPRQLSPSSHQSLIQETWHF